MKSRTAIGMLSISLMLLVVSPSFSAWAADEPQKDDAVVMRINGEPITQATLDKEMRRYEGQMGLADQSEDASKRDAIRKKVLDGIVDRTLLLQESQKLGIQVEAAQVEEELNRLKSKLPDPDQFQNLLKRMQMSEEELKAEYRRRMTIRALIEKEVAPKATVSEKEAKAFYDENPNLFKVPERVRASHILVKTEANATDQDKSKAREKLLAIKKRLDKGEDFATLAKENSDCPSAAKGGDLDYFQRGQMVAPFEEAAFGLKVGQVSDVVETQFGYHLIKVVDRKEAGIMPFEEMKPTIEEHLKQQKITEQMATYVAGLKSKAKIETVSQ